MQQVPLVIDTDPGVDDFLAITFALRSPEFEVVGLTTVGGNAPLRLATRNALRALEAAHVTDVPVAPGAARPLRGRFRYSPRFHGPTGLPGRMPVPRARPSAESAVEFLRRQAEEHSGKLNVLALGPLTNLANLIERHPETAGSIQKLVIMGGAVDVRGNTTSDAEFNIWNDAEAADIVFRSGLPTLLIPLDVCDAVTISAEVIGEGQSACHRLLRAWFGQDRSRTAFELYDPLAAAAAAMPTLVEAERTGLSVVTGAGAERGRVVRTPSRPSVQVALRVDSDRARRVIQQRVLDS